MEVLSIIYLSSVIANIATIIQAGDDFEVTLILDTGPYSGTNDEIIVTLYGKTSTYNTVLKPNGVVLPSIGATYTVSSSKEMGDMIAMSLRATGGDGWDLLQVQVKNAASGKTWKTKQRYQAFGLPVVSYRKEIQSYLLCDDPYNPAERYYKKFAKNVQPESSLIKLQVSVRSRIECGHLCNHDCYCTAYYVNEVAPRQYECITAHVGSTIDSSETVSASSGTLYQYDMPVITPDV